MSHHSEICFTRTVIPWGFKGVYKLQLVVPTEKVQELCDLLLIEVVPLHIFTSPIAINIKGGPSFPSTAKNSREAKEELLFISGHTEAEDLPDSHCCMEGERFGASLITSFAGLVDSRTVRYEITHDRSGAIDLDQPLRLLGRTAHLHIDHLRINIDFFDSRPLRGMLRISPSIAHSLSLDMSQNELKLTLTTECLRSKSEIPTLPEEILLKLDQLLVRLLNFSILQDYRKKAAP